MAQPPAGYRQLRAGRVSVAGQLYFITKVAAERLPAGCPPAAQRARGVLLQAGVPPLLLDSLAWLQQQGVLAVVAYCLMPDHLHLLIQLGPAGSVSAAMQRFAGFTGRAVAQHTGRRPLWQPGFQDHALRAETAIAAVVAYIEQNPVRAGLVAEATAWPWASQAAAAPEEGAPE